MNILEEKNMFEFDSGKSGDKVCILAGVHGNEIGGIEALKLIIKKIEDGIIKLKKGKIIFVFANPKAIEKNVRFVEENLNRCFLENKLKTDFYEEKLLYDLKNILESCDICLDLHSSFIKNSKPFIICEKNAFDLVQNFPMEIICSGFDLIQPGGTDYYMNRIGKIGICVECGFLKDEESIGLAKDSLLSLLISLDMVKNDFVNGRGKIHEKKYYQVDSLYFAQDEFKLSKNFQDFDNISKNQTIGFDANKKIKSDFDGFILFARSVSNDSLDREAFLLGKNKTNI